ncbi:MAG: DHH family phosphoesterase [Candidatus Paceibacterota bacterium]|jgi:nanoRNase/pAp phosphatase (c-di-AMP/oligoRNAs hydrolase)
MSAEERQTRAQKFREFVTSKTGRFVIIIAQIDPDALGVAFMLWYILKNLGKDDVVVIYAGPVGHPQNRALINRFGLCQKMKTVSAYKHEDGDILCLVDSSSVSDARIPAFKDIFAKSAPQIVIDHHRGDTFNNGGFYWIEEVGAASTLAVELFQDLGLRLDEDYKWIAITSAVGIYTDTKDLDSASERDLLAYSFISKGVSITPFVKYKLPASHFTNMARALNNLSASGPRAVTGLGFISSSSADDVAIIADYLIRREEYNLVLVWAIIEGVVRLSVRTSGVGLSVDEFLKAHLPEGSSGGKLAPDGHGEGGGSLHLFDGDFWVSPATRPMIEQAVGERMKEIIFKD